MGYEARFVVDTHAHITTLYKPAGKKSLELEAKGLWNGLNGELEPFDNSPLTLYDMGRYGVDMCILKPSITGTTNEMQAMLVDQHPDKFRAMCSDQKLKIKVWREEKEWNLQDAVDEVEAALKTGKFVGIGEFVPGGMQVNRTPKPDYDLRLHEFRHFMELARQYGVTIDLHEGAVGYSWDVNQLYSQLAREYPDVPIIYCHGGGHEDSIIKRACAVAGRSGNIYLETGSWTAEQYMIALDDPNVGVTQLIWGHDYGNVPQYMTRPQATDSGAAKPPYFMKRWPKVPTYQTDFWGWALHQVRRLKDWVTQDEINLILGGNAAKIFKLPVPYERMFPEGRPDIWGIDWEKSIPLIPKDQIINPD